MHRPDPSFYVSVGLVSIECRIRRIYRMWYRFTFHCVRILPDEEWAVAKDSYSVVPLMGNALHCHSVSFLHSCTIACADYGGDSIIVNGFHCDACPVPLYEMEALALKVGEAVFSQYGILGAVCVGLIIFLVKIMKDHRAERDSIIRSLTTQNDRMIDSFDKNTTTLTQVKTLIETLTRR